MVTKRKDFSKENISDSKFAVNNNLDSCNKSLRLNCVANNDISSIENNLRTPNKTVENISPYLNGTKLQIFSQISEKKVLQKKSTDITSSFAHACKIYRANSDEFRCNKRNHKKDKISPINKLPEPTIPQAVSDMNDSEYLKRVDNNRRYKQKKRRVPKDVCRSNETKTYEFYNGDLLCSPGIKADPNNLNKNNAKNCKMLKTKKKRKGIENIQSGDVWSMLRDMNTFQCISSPPISVGSIETIKKKGRCRRNEKETGFIETCTTEEFSYISSYDITSNSQSRFSRQSSFDRVTIIDRTGDFKSKKIFDLNPRTSKKKPCKTKDYNKNKQSERQNLNKLPNNLEIGNTKNEANNNVYIDLKKCLSKESLNGSPNRYDSQATVLNNCDKSMENLTPKDKFIKITPKKQSTFAQCNGIFEAIKCHQSNDQLLEASEKSSKAGFSLSNTKRFNKYNNKGKEMLSNIREPHKNPRVSIITPKLTKTEIRKRLANLTFPIVILGKDEMSSKFYVVDYEFEQFNGLSQQIWLYMTEWLDDLTSRDKHNSFLNTMNDLNFNKSNNILNVRMPNGKNECNVIDQDAEFKNKTDGTENSKTINKTIVETSTNNNKTHKIKVLNQFKNKMFGFISRKNQKVLADENNVTEDNLNHVLINRIDPPEGDAKERNKYFDAIKNQTGSKYPWSKVKWASDFIDNILRKMKKGIYYTDNFEEVKSKLDSEIAIPVKTDHVIEDVSEVISTETLDNAIIPGFDDIQYIAPITVDVKMITRTQISIYHCSTNVVLQFDITIPSKIETISPFSLTSFAPVIYEDKTTLYKCKTSLANAVLPAQLCSIIPKLLTKILEIPKKETHVPMVSCETTLKLPHLVERLTDGNFSMNTPIKVMPKINCEKILSWDFYSYNNMKLLPTIETKLLWVPLFKSIDFIIHKCHGSHCTDELILKKPVRNNCTALVPYVPSPTKANILPFSNFKFKLHNDLQQCLTRYIYFIGGVNFWGELSKSENFNNINNTDKSRRTPTLVSDFPLNVSISALPFKAIPYIETTKTTEIKRLKNEKSGYQCVRKNIRKTLKLHTKCKSMTNMVKKCFSTPLDKIVNLEDFLQALGCCKQLSAVLQGYSEKKILSSINEMKCWIKDISSTQALLVLLLSNKKENKNLKRFRPVLLQGIAVKRITTASELDMEIEVIEKENICVSQNEGISLLLTSNGYNLLDELCWIAKTTASDYQKPFDDSSKKLLKSLLEKRKKLSPSYLRVMARYVGLGLLKPRKNYT